MKRAPGTGKESLKKINFGYAYTNGFYVLAEGFDIFRLRPIGHWREDKSIRQFFLYENNFCWMEVWELNPERIGLISLKASATWWRTILALGLHDW
jgi:hypothetical protein